VTLHALLDVPDDDDGIPDQVRALDGRLITIDEAWAEINIPIRTAPSPAGDPDGGRIHSATFRRCGRAIDPALVFYRLASHTIPEAS